MSEFWRGIRTRISRPVSRTGSDRKTFRPARARNPLPAEQQTLGNQAGQRFARSHPTRSPGASPRYFGGVCRTCAAQLQGEPKPGQPGEKYQQNKTIQIKRAGGPAMPVTAGVMQPRAGTGTSRRGFQTESAAEGILSRIRGLHFFDPGVAGRGYIPRHGTFPFRLRVEGIPYVCNNLRWEKFISGDLTVEYDTGQPRSFTGCQIARFHNRSARAFPGNWCDDLAPKMRPGPKTIAEAEGNADCRPIARSGEPVSNRPRPTFRGPSVRPVSTYSFWDAPGMIFNFGQQIEANGPRFTGITYALRFQHKLWRAGQRRPYFTIRYRVTGAHRNDGTDTRTVGPDV